MIEDKMLESNVTVLRTPLVDVEIVDEEDNSISFDIVESCNTSHGVYIDNDENNIIEAIDYDEKQIRIKTASLEIGKKYYVKTSVPQLLTRQLKEYIVQRRALGIYSAV